MASVTSSMASTLRPNGGGNGFAGPLSFRLTGTGLTLDDFAEKSINGDVAAFFALDIYSKATGNTGLVDCCTRSANPVRRPHPGSPRPVRGRLGRHRHAAARYQEAHSGRRSRSELTKEIRSPSRQMATVASPVPLARGSVVSAVPLPPATFTSTKLDTARSKTDRATLAKDQPRSAELMLVLGSASFSRTSGKRPYLLQDPARYVLTGWYCLINLVGLSG